MSIIGIGHIRTGWSALRVVDLDGQVRRLDDDARRLALVARPLTRQVGC